MFYKATVLEDSPVGYWRLGESGGGETADSSGSGNVGEYVNAPILGVAGALVGDPDTAVTFAKASKQYVSVAHSASLNVGDIFTLETWLKRASVSSATEQLFNKGSNVPVLRLNSANKVELQKYGAGSIVISTIAMEDTNWHHIVATKSGASVKLYIDNVDRTGTVTNRTCESNSTKLYLGSEVGGTEEWFNGTRDEIALYKTALSAARVEAHYQAGTTSPGPIPGSRSLLGMGR